MLTTVAGVCALRRLRIAWEEDAGDAFPSGVLTELLVLHDVCKGLELGIFQVTDVLGKDAYNCIQEHLDTYIVPAHHHDPAEAIPETITAVA